MRNMTLPVLLALILAVGAATTGVAAAQFDAGIQIRVVDENGVQLGPDRPICAYVYVDGQPVIASREVVSRPDAVYSVPSGLPLIAGAATCLGEAESFVSVWHYGAPLAGGPDLRAPEFVLAPGEVRTVEIMVGKAEISGTISGGDAERVCVAEALSVGAQFASVVAGTIEGTDYKIDVPPGRWIVRAKCESNEWAFGPGNVPHLGDAQVLDLVHGDTRAGIELSPRRQADVSSILIIRMNETSATVPWCADFTTPEGSIVDRRIQRTAVGFASISTRLPWGEYRVRIWDCGNAGFDNRWFPYSHTLGGAASVVLPEGQFETIPEGLVQLVPDPDRICNGLPATLVGTNGRDRLYGTDGADVILALDGRDVVRAGDGPDTVCGGEGRDVIFGGPKADTILGGTERDRLKGGSGADTIFGERGRDVLIGGFGNDTLYGNGGLADLLDGRDGLDRCVDPSDATIRIGCETG